MSEAEDLARENVELRRAAREAKRREFQEAKRRDAERDLQKLREQNEALRAEAGVSLPAPPPPPADDEIISLVGDYDDSSKE